MKIQLLTLAALAVAVPSFAQDKMAGPDMKGGRMAGGKTMVRGAAMMKGMTSEEMASLKQMWTKMTPDERKAMGMAMRNMMGAGKMDDKAMMMRATKGMTDAQKKAMSDHWMKMSKVEQSAMKKMMMNASAMKMGPKMPMSPSMGKKAG